MANEITPENLDRCIAEIQARKLVGESTTKFFFNYYDLDSAEELDTRTLELVNRKFASHRLPTVDGSGVLLHEEIDQNSLWSKRLGN